MESEMEKNPDQMGSGPSAPPAPGDYPQPPAYSQRETPGGYQTPSNYPAHAPNPGGYPTHVLPPGCYPAHAQYPGSFPTQTPPGYIQAQPPHFFPGPQQGGYFYQPPGGHQPAPPNMNHNNGGQSQNEKWYTRLGKKLRGPVGQNFHKDHSKFTINDYKSGYSVTVHGKDGSGGDFQSGGQPGNHARPHGSPQHGPGASAPFRGKVTYRDGMGNKAVIDNGNYVYENGKLVSGP